MRISDWSSDVCSSDLLEGPASGGGGGCALVGVECAPAAVGGDLARERLAGLAVICFECDLSHIAVRSRIGCTRTTQMRIVHAYALPMEGVCSRQIGRAHV